MGSRKNKNRGRRPTASERARTRPCPCGSGRAYKNCCARKEDDAVEEPGSGRGGAKVVIASVAVCLAAVAVLLAFWRPWSEPEAVPEPWEYDEAGNRHWHPIPGYWHDGPPPPRFGDAAPPPGIPEPWEYDAANDLHWDPGHGHWHRGSPPPPAEW